jgi:hypothetical protein
MTGERAGRDVEIAVLRDGVRTTLRLRPSERS